MTEKSKPICYVDMDGVIADLYNYVAEIHDVDHYSNMTKDQWEVFFKDTDAYSLFSTIPPFPNANELLNLVKTYAGSYRILSSPLNYDIEGSKKGKSEWLAKHITVPAERVVYDGQKYKYAQQPDGTPNILIDDYGVNIRAWTNAGGTAVKFQNDENDISEIKNVLEKEFKKDK